MEDKNLFNKFKDRENLEYEFDEEDDWDDEFEDFDDEKDFDDYNDGDWDENPFNSHL